MGEIGRLTFRHLGIPKRSEYRNSDFMKFICGDLATLCKNLVILGPVNPEFKKGKDVDQQFDCRYVRLAAPLLDLAGISTQFCFTYTLEGVTAIPRGLHAKLCHAHLGFSPLFSQTRLLYFRFFPFLLLSYPRRRQSRGRVFISVCLCICLFFCMISQKLNLTQKCSTMSCGNPFSLGSRG